MEPPAPLPDGVRRVVVALAADALSSLPPDDVPPSLRAVARFTPAKRARVAAGGLAAALEADGRFRHAAAVLLRAREPQLCAAVTDGVLPPAAQPEQLGAALYLLRPDGWQERLAAVGGAVAGRAAAQASADELARLTARLAQQEERSATEAARAAAELAAARADGEQARQEAAGLRRRVRELGERAAAAERRADMAPAVSVPDRSAEVEALTQRVAELEAAVAAARAAARTPQRAADLRLRVLVDTLVRASAGVQRELALPPLDTRPADLVDADAGRPPSPSPQGRDVDDPALLAELLGAPLAHLVVDGYNVTKTGWSDQTLEVQRQRLVTGLGAVAARTGAEVTVVFDGQDAVAPVAPSATRGVRVRFSRTGSTADDLIRELVRAEPAGRALVVVTSDRAVVDDVRADGARTAPSVALLRLLER